MDLVRNTILTSHPELTGITSPNFAPVATTSELKEDVILIQSVWIKGYRKPADTAATSAPWNT